MKKLLPFFLAFAMVTISSCDSDEPTDPPTDNVVIITQDITNVTTWSGDSIYIIKKYDFYVENTLDIEPGCIIKFHPTDGPWMTLGSGGTVMAIGTATNPIIFTSYKDDVHGGDNNGDGNSTSPAAKDWGHINTNGENGSTFNYCHFYYGGAGTLTYTLSIEAGSVATVSNCTFAHNDGSDNSGNYCVLSASTAEVGTMITDNIFYDNVRPLDIPVNISLNASNTFSNPANPAETNTYNAIFVETIEDLDQQVTWSETEVPYVIWDNDWWLESGARLTLADNVVLKFRSGSAAVLEDGTSNIINYNGTGVFFTSYNDDVHGGDTNADGNATSPAAGDWEGFYDNTLSIPAPYFYTWSNILYDDY